MAPLVRAASVRRPHGVRGEVRVEPLGSDAARFVPGLTLRREDGAGTFTVVSARPVPGGDVLLGLAEVHSRDAAEQLRGAYLCVEHRDRRTLRDDEWFVADLVGLRVRTPDGDDLGVVDDVEEYAAHEVLVVRDGTVVRRLPMVRAFVAGVDTVAGVVTVTPWEEE